MIQQVQYFQNFLSDGVADWTLLLLHKIDFKNPDPLIKHFLKLKKPKKNNS